MKRHSHFAPLLLILLLFGNALAAMAHPAELHAGGAGSAATLGFLHPFAGLDHLLVMVAVGLWAVQLGGRSLWLLPSGFSGSMVIGGFLGLSAHHASFIEHGILASILLLGTALGMAWRPPVFVAALGIAAAGICHGFAHGSEMPRESAPLLFLTGMACATALLHAGGMIFGSAFQRRGLNPAIRMAGLGLLAFALFSLASAA